MPRTRIDGKPDRRKPPLRPNRRDRERYRAFATAYLAVGQPTYLNAERSAKEAGYGKGYIKGNAYRLVANRGVQEEMRKLRDERAAQSTIAGPVEVLEVLSQQLRTLPNELMAGGELIPLDKMTREQAQAVAGAKTRTRNIVNGEDVITEVTLEYKLVDRQKAAEILAKHHGLFEKDNAQKPDPAPVALVAMPTGPMSLEEWTRQAMAILNAGKQAESPKGAAV